MFDFDTVIDRSRTWAFKWDIRPGELPMWVADMDFAAAPCVRKAIERRAAHGIFGYTDVPSEWKRAYTDWWHLRHGMEWQEEELLFANGVIPAISTMVRRLTAPAEKIVVQTPVYNMFFNSIENNGRRVLKNPLKELQDGTFAMDFDDLEEKLADPQTTLLLLCNPQNPTGTVWDAHTLSEVGRLCEAYGVIPVSDEIHCDLTRPGVDYVPFASVNERNRRIGVTCISSSKAFNLAGLHQSAVAVADPFLRHKIWRALNTDECAEPNAFAIDAAIAAFSEGGSWLDELRAYLFENRRLVDEALKKRGAQLKDEAERLNVQEKTVPAVMKEEKSQGIPAGTPNQSLRLMPGDATYLLWLDARSLPRMTASAVRRETGLWLSGGEVYGSPGFLRMNVACPRGLVEDGINRLLAAEDVLK